MGRLHVSQQADPALAPALCGGDDVQGAHAQANLLGGLSSILSDEVACKSSSKIDRVTVWEGRTCSISQQADPAPAPVLLGADDVQGCMYRPICWASFQAFN